MRTEYQLSTFTRAADGHAGKPIYAREDGLGLIETIVALSIVTVVISALLTTLRVAMIERMRDDFAGDANSLAITLAETLAVPAQCQKAFETTSLTVTNRRDLNPSATAQSIDDAIPVGGIALQDRTLGRARFEKATLTLQNSLHGNAYTALLTIAIHPLHASDQIRSVIRHIPLQVDMVDANPTTLISSCNAESHVFSGGSAPPFTAGLSCNTGQVLVAISPEGVPKCESIFNLLPSTSCLAGEFVGINPKTQSLFCISTGGATPKQVRGPGCLGAGCVAMDGGPCSGAGCKTNGQSCQGAGCVAEDTWPATADTPDW